MPNGRPTELTIERLEMAEASLEQSPLLSVLAGKLGVTDRTIRNWHRWGREEAEKREKGKEPSENRTAHVRFFQLIKKAHADFKIRHLTTITERLLGWQALAWTLERLWPAEFGQQRHEMAAIKKELADLKKHIGADV